MMEISKGHEKPFEIILDVKPIYDPGSIPAWPGRVIPQTEIRFSPRNEVATRCHASVTD